MKTFISIVIIWLVATWLLKSVANSLGGKGGNRHK